MAAVVVGVEDRAVKTSSLTSNSRKLSASNIPGRLGPSTVPRLGPFSAYADHQRQKVKLTKRKTIPAEGPLMDTN